MSESLQVFIGGIQKFSNDRDFAKFIEKTIPNYDDIVTGLYKKKASSSVIIRLKNEDAKIFFLDIMAGKMYKNRWLKIKDQEVPVPNKAFASMKRLLRTKECKVTERTEEELKEEMGKDLKDKLIPYHNVPYEEQLRLKSEYLKDIFYKYVARIEKEVETKNEAALPNWLTLYWNSLKDQTAPNESEADPQKVVAIQDDAEEAKDTEEVKEIEELKGVTSSSREKRLPCSFEGILPCDEEYRKGYRNKIEFTIGRNYDDNQLCVGFLKGNANKGLLYVDYPKDLPHISDYAADCAEKLQTLLREYDEKYALNEYNCITHAGCWRMFIYKESKRTNEKLISVVLSRNIMTEEQMEEFKKALLETFNDPKIVSISLIESDTLSGGYDYSDKITYLSKKTYSEEVNGFKFSVSPLAFFQVNTHVFEKILNTIKEWGQFDPWKTVLLDVCWGTGVIGIALSNYVKKIIGIEIVQAAIDDCYSNCELNNLTCGEDGKCQYYVGRAEDELPRISKEVQGKRIIAIVDPPRSGLHSTVLRALRTTIGLDRIVYVSCNANSLADNLHTLCMPESKKRRAPEFRPIKFCGADLFPYSPHVECIMLLERFYEG